MIRISTENRIFAGTRPGDFVGRAHQLERLLLHANSASRDSNGIALLSTPSSGASELLRKIYDRLFTEQDDVIPFYFEIKASDGAAQNVARRFLGEFLLQTVSFRRRDPRIIHAAPEMDEIAELAVPADGYWIDRLVETYKDETKTSDSSFVRNCLSAPLRAAANDARVVVMIDNLHEATRLAGGDRLLDEIIEIYGRASIPFVFAGHRRFLFARTPFETMALESFSFEEAGKFVENLAAKTGIAINDQTRDLIAVQFRGNAGQINSLFATAADTGSDLNTFHLVERSYTDAVFGGRIGKNYDSILSGVLPDAEHRTRVLKLLSENMNARGGKVPVTYWKRHAGLDTTSFEAVLSALHHYEIISVGSGSVEIDLSNIVLCDYLRGRIRLEIASESRALVVGDSLSENIVRAPELMARFYRRSAAIGLRDLLSAFDGQQISPALLDYGKFKDEFKGADDEKILKSLKESIVRIDLPHIVYTANTGAFYPKLNELCDTERSAIGLGSANKEETAWIAVEIDSKLEATREIAEFWCDRLEMVALTCNFENYKLWLIAPEGFAPDAMDLLRDRNAYGSNRKQVDLLAAVLNAELKSAAKTAGKDYEIVVPMGEDTEMIAAHTVEEIAKRHNFPPKSINQIKTALVEACINAAEHSLSPDRRIYQKFTVDADKLTVTVSNRGLRLADKIAKEVNPAEGRRGWGLKLMRGLMDDVKIEQTDDGTRITMVKYLRSQEVT